MAVNSVSACQCWRAALTSPVDESNCISWAENTEELPSKCKHTAINPLTTARSTLKGKSITMLTWTQKILKLSLWCEHFGCAGHWLNSGIMPFKWKCFVFLYFYLGEQ